MLTACKDAGIHTAVETCAQVSWKALEDVLPVTDLFMIDLKHMDPEHHRAATGSSNQRILENVSRLADTGKPIIFRVPVVPTVNDTPEEIGEIARFVADLAARAPGEIRLELLPFHRLAADKYRSLGLDYRAADLTAPSKEHMAVLWEAARAAGAPLVQRAG